MIGYSSAVENARAQAILNALGTAPLLLLLDAVGNTIATQAFPNPPGVIFNNNLVLLGFPVATTISSQALVGATPTSATIMSSGGLSLITGIPINYADSEIVVTSSSVSPGQQLGLLTGIMLQP